MTNLLPFAEKLRIRTIGKPCVMSPLKLEREAYVDESSRISLSADAGQLAGLIKEGKELPSFERAGPRERIYFDPAKTCAGIVTCGGLCPGLNDVIRSITLTLASNYGVRRVLGFRLGFKGLSNSGPQPLLLTPECVDGIQQQPGTILGSSRGPQNPAEMMDNLLRQKVNMLFVIGGDGTTRGAMAIADEAERRNVPLSVIGVPKTIDNDVCWTTMSFGFFTAVEEARKVIFAAHAEAKGCENGVVVVKLMGRQSGFIAEYATLASSVANFCLIPEIRFELHGEKGLLPALKQRLLRKGHAVVVVAEGAGQHLFDNEQSEHDASGNVRLRDVGTLLCEQIKNYLSAENLPHSVRYIDPSYLVRSTPADTLDSIFCLMLGMQAAHAGMAGKTAMSVGSWNQNFVHVPMELLVQKRRVVNPLDQWWQAVSGITVTV